jgi:hypothetical protein
VVHFAGIFAGIAKPNAPRRIAIPNDAIEQMARKNDGAVGANPQQI